jgi:hypothetical protein
MGLGYEWSALYALAVYREYCSQILKIIQGFF